MIKRYRSPKIGDGSTPEKAFRPSVHQVMMNGNVPFGLRIVTELDNSYLVEVDTTEIGYSKIKTPEAEEI